MLLNVLYWIILILCLLGVVVVTTTYPNWHYVGGGATIALFIIIGLRSFRTEIK
jgi:hypothetical protein